MDVTLQVCGAARTVTALSLLFATPRGRILVDCGLFQGPKTLKALNWEPFPYDPRTIDAVLLTHSHIDHSGLIPRLVREGFRGPVHATRASVDLCSCMLPDSGHVQETEVRHLNRRNRARGAGVVQPIYTAEDAERAMRAFHAVPFDQWMPILPGLRARWWNAGHMLGSASIELAFGEDDRPMRVLVSGDLGPDASALHHNPEGPQALDHVFVESTYGDEDRPATSRAERRASLAALVREAARPGGALLIPAFAVERTHEICWDLVALMESGQLPQAPILVDSPLATRATEVFVRHAQAMQDGASIRRALRSPLLRFTESIEESRSIAEIEGFHIIIAGSGMCDAGRIRGHLKRWLWSAEATVLLSGYQAEGTLGRLLEEGRRDVRIQGETIRVAARIRRMADYSGHADAPELARWLRARGPVAGGVFLVHGEPDAMDGLTARLTQEGIAAKDRIIQPRLDDVFTLSPGAMPVPRPSPRRRADPEKVGRPDWYNQRAALLIAIEAAFEKARGEAERQALISRLRRALDGD